MAALDWVFVAVLLASMLMGAWRGLVSSNGSSFWPLPVSYTHLTLPTTPYV